MLKSWVSLSMVAVGIILRAVSSPRQWTRLPQTDCCSPLGGLLFYINRALTRFSGLSTYLHGHDRISRDFTDMVLRWFARSKQIMGTGVTIIGNLTNEITYLFLFVGFVGINWIKKSLKNILICVSNESKKEPAIWRRSAEKNCSDNGRSHQY